MIINFHFNQVKDNRFGYDGPYVIFERNTDYEVAVRNFHVELKSNQISKDIDLWCLSTNLVDRSPANPEQAISYFTMTKGKLNQTSHPVAVVFHPLETNNIENPQFFIKRINKNKIIQIEHAFVQLEIRKCSEYQKV